MCSHIFHAVEHLTAGIDIHRVGFEHHLGHIIADVGCDFSHEFHGHALFQSVVEEKLHLVGFHADDARRIEKPLVGQFLQFVGCHHPISRFLGIVFEFQHHGSQFFAVFVGQQRVALVPDRDAHVHGGVAGEHHVLGHIDKVHRDDDFLFVGLVQGNQQPEGGAQQQEKQKNQELLIHHSEQEVPDLFPKAEYV